MLRRLTACLMASLILFSALPAHADVEDLAILSQWDERFFGAEFRYSDIYFRFGGCGPASVANSLIAALGVTDQDLAAGILYDLLYLLTQNKPVSNKVQVAHLSCLQSVNGQLPALDERYPALNQALADFGGLFLYDDGLLTPEKLETVLPELDGRKAIYHGSLTSKNRWHALYGLVEALINSGHQDATIVVGFIGGGTTGTSAPFRSGKAGHYISLYFPVESFSRTGVFYVLDSQPRSLFDEPYGDDTPFLRPYDFVGKQNLSTSLDRFNQHFEVERVLPTILRVSPKGPALDALDAAGQGELPLSALLPALNDYILFYGMAHIFISFPGAQ